MCATNADCDHLFQPDAMGSFKSLFINMDTEDFEVKELAYAYPSHGHQSWAGPQVLYPQPEAEELLYSFNQHRNVLQTQQPSTRMLLSELVSFLHATALMSSPLLELPFPQGVFRPQVGLKLPCARLLSLDSECGSSVTCLSTSWSMDSGREPQKAFTGNPYAAIS